MATKVLSKQQLDQLREVANRMVQSFRPRQKHASFTWYGRQYVVRRSYFRTFLETADGEELASDYDHTTKEDA